MKEALGNAKRLKTATNSDIVTKAPQPGGLKDKFRRRREERLWIEELLWR